ncbi:6,7-dimethyl-8-ribityllumazine synthase [Aestuariispira insulae]|uniref:6,7-dimethyl-8-ribityllumazine synthase n=1 Tax=Aestuariispira insulae TaxID=1461337 RepID=A0A3D9HV33_9PROT|nr:6,7-dimethyl-8-ribityllumazine synthase [Aestuariispira insulae]RED53373.1 6,7-dimethyl-8-ribityllumazine synthase [Aestuariispira insulae]
MADKKPHIMIVEARFYDDIADEMATGAIEALEAAGATYERFEVAGAFELPSAISYAIIQQELNDEHKFDGYIALGCVIRGETSHYDYVCGESARGLMDLSIQHGLSLANGVLTVENRDQAWARASREQKNKGGEVARACLGMIDLKTQFGLFPR